MAYRKRPGAQGAAVVTEPPPRPCSAPYSSEDLPPEDARDPDQEEDVPQHPYPASQDPDLPDSRPDTPVTPEHTHEHGHCHGHHHARCHGHVHGHVDSLDDGDSSSDYVNNTSDEEEEEEEDYDEGLPEEDEGVTYYIRYCPEDDSYLEGPADYHGAPEPPPAETDECQEAVEEWVDEGGVEGEEVGDVLRCEVLQQDADEQQLYDGRPEPVLDHLPSQPPNHNAHSAALQEDAGIAAQEQEEGEESEEYLPNDEEEVEDEEEEEEEEDGRVRDGDRESYGGEYYGGPEDNGNSVCVSQYRGLAVGEGGVVVAGGEAGGEETEEDIDQIVAEIKMSMSMGSLSSGSASMTDQSPEELAHDSVPGPASAPAPSGAPYPAEARAKPQPSGPGSYPPAPHRHDGRPKSLNIPPARHPPDLQRGFKMQPRSPEERQRWAQEQVRAQRGSGGVGTPN